MEVKYPETGKRLREIRHQLKLPMDALGNETGMSRSYISDFERGVKRPTSKYLIHLHDKYRVNLNYIFGSDGRMFRREAGEEVNFGKFQDEVDEMLYMMNKVHSVLYSVLGYYSRFKIKNKDLIREELESSD